ncbi:hypothetical protein [Neptunicoccus cionae]|uniref:Arginine transporter n=1 Tax=Neptunicoccus cionae TaxID=2035344 RepID=A0A916VM84_9RHOB|nr:hypothetical protein [Amylibacter cionae]GGA07504.1 hypothetical protein GCM10011498_04200 [Amylibacter cionae]
MKKTIVATLTVALLTASAPAYASKKIERACKSSDRPASASLCSCIQQVANVKLSSSDQRLAAKFFKDPDLAQETRQSDDKRKESFWLRYKAFGALAHKTCG